MSIFRSVSYKWNLYFVFLLGVGLLAHASESSQQEPQSGACEALMARTRPVSMAAFLSHLARTGNIHTLVESMEQSYGALNFRIAVPATNRSIYILQERDLITSLLRKQSKLPFVNRNFDLSHGHFNSINSVNTTDPLWTDLHYGLLEIVRAKKISPIMEKYKGLLTYVPAYNLNTQLEEFYLRVWSEYCLGPVDIEKYRQLRERLIAVLGHVFHKNPLNRWPWLGHVSSRWNHWRYRAELQQVDEELRELLAESIAHREGLFYELYDRLRGRYPNAFQIAVDNSFLGVLVYDFVYIIMADALAHIAQDPSLDRGEQVKQSRHDGFLYPFRFRRVDEDDDGFKVGDFAIYNLQKAGLYFSAGLRFCPGASLFQEISTKTLEILSDVKITEVQPGTPIVRSPNRDLPFMLSSHEVAVECPYQQSARPEEKE